MKRSSSGLRRAEARSLGPLQSGFGPAEASQVVKLGLLQTACAPDPKANLKKTLTLAERATRQGAQIICTQELFRSQYFCQSEDHENFKLAEPIPGPSTEAFQKLARKHRVVVIALYGSGDGCM